MILLEAVEESHSELSIPALLNYDGRVSVAGTPFTGNGRFKFALVSHDGSEVYWRNAPDNHTDGQPDTNVVVGVEGGLFTVFLGDTNLVSRPTGMVFRMPGNWRSFQPWDRT